MPTNCMSLLLPNRRIKDCRKVSARQTQI